MTLTFICPPLIFFSLKLTVRKDNIPNFVVMDQNLKDGDFSERGVKVDNPLRNTDYDEEKSYKCNQFEYACILCEKQLEETFKNTQWRKIKQMQPV